MPVIGGVPCRRGYLTPGWTESIPQLPQQPAHVVQEPTLAGEDMEIAIPHLPGRFVGLEGTFYRGYLLFYGHCQGAPGSDGAYGNRRCPKVRFPQTHAVTGWGIRWIGGMAVFYQTTYPFQGNYSKEGFLICG